jgi:biotin carboxylase
MTVAVFVAPYLLEATARFVAAAADLPGVRCAIVTHEPADRLPAHLRVSLDAHWQVEDAFDPAQLVGAVRGLADQLGGVDRILAALEQLQVPMAQVREHLGIPGMDVETARSFRDKGRMKDVMRAAGIPCARHRLATSADDVRAFVGEVGLPVVVKPPAGAGARGTFRLDEPADVENWLAADAPTAARPSLVEEFLSGEEHSYDAVSVDGEVRFRSISRYLPTPLEVLRNPWMQWVVLLPREVGGPEHADIDRIGPAALRALGLRTGLAHMEWFRRPDGSVAVSEVAARPPGAQITTLLSYAHDLDFHTAWARLMILDAFDPPERRWAVGAVYVRAQGGGGRIASVRGVEELQRELGHLVVEAQLPEPGQTPTGTYEGEGHVIVRDADTAVVEQALARIVRSLRVETG